jgi:hypothetical protein
MYKYNIRYVQELIHLIHPFIELMHDHIIVGTKYLAKYMPQIYI